MSLTLARAAGIALLMNIAQIVCIAIMPSLA